MTWKEVSSLGGCQAVKFPVFSHWPGFLSVIISLFVYVCVCVCVCVTLCLWVGLNIGMHREQWRVVLLLSAVRKDVRRRRKRIRRETECGRPQALLSSHL